MKNRVIHLSLALLCSAIMAGVAAAADNIKMPEYYETARGAIERLLARGDETKPFIDDILVAQNYLRNADNEYRKNLSWGKLEKSAEPTVRYYAAMAELHAGVVASRLGKLDQEQEKGRLERLISDVKGKIRIFDDKNAEINRLSQVQEGLRADLASKRDEAARLGKDIEQLKNDKAAQESALALQISGLNSDLAARGGTITDLQRQLTELKALLTEKEKLIESMTAAHKRTSDELQSLSAQKGAEFVDVQAKLRLSERSREMLSDAGKIANLLRFADDRLTMLYPRSSFFKVTSKGATLLPEGGTILTGLAGLLKKYPDYRAMVKVHGSGQPTKQEDVKGTEQMARQLKDYLLEKGGLPATAVEASGVGTAAPLYPADMAVANRRVEITLQPAATP